MKYVFYILILLSTLQADNFKNAIDKINTIRSHSGLATLRYDSRLKKAAYRHARYLGVNGEKGHTEKQGRPEFSGVSPSNRIVRAGYHSRAVVENISFGEKSYSSSIDTLMATIYHRHGFLDFRIDSIGPARAGRRKSVFVYDMSLSSLDRLCLYGSSVNSGKYVYDICSDRKKRISKSKFYALLRAIEKKSKPIVKYPYNGQKNVPSKYRRERPDPLAHMVNAGYPVSILFNPSYYRSVRLESFTLKNLSGKYIKGRVLSKQNDRYHKLNKNVFVFAPLSPLYRGAYEAHFTGVADGKRVNHKWRFWVK